MDKKKFIVGSTQINNGFAGQFYLPYSIGLLQAYFIHNSIDKDKITFLNTIYKREEFETCVNKLISSDIVLFSLYVWNENITLEIAKKIKKIDKKKFIIVGGPSVPDNLDGKAEKFLRDNPFIDVCIHQEGERTILKLLDEFPNNNLLDTPNISFFKGNKFYNNKNLVRLKSFENSPSPYLCGIFDNLIKKNPQERWLASWETNRGCPFSCAYCDWGSATNSKVSRIELDRVFRELDWFSKNKVEFIFCCDANFGMLPRDYEIALKAVKNKKKYGYPKVLSVQNTKNARERAYKVQKLLADNGLSKGVTLAMQSVDPHTLKSIKRDNISIEDYKELQRRFTEDGITTYTEFILGLPGDTYESFADGVSDIIKSGQHNRIQFNNLSILPNAEMARDEYIKKHKIKTIFTPIVNPHGSLDEDPKDGIKEKQELVISTNSLSKEDWIKTRLYASVSEFFYFNKVLQIPIMFKSILEKKSYKNIFEELMALQNNKEFSTIASVIKSLRDHALSITKGNFEFILDKETLGIFWPPGELEYIKILKKNKFDQFYEECIKYFCNTGELYINNILLDCINLNKSMMRRPFEKQDEELSISYNIFDCYTLIKKNKKFSIKKSKQKLKIIKSDFVYETWDDWAREVIWYGHRSGKYTCKIIDLKKNSINKLENKESVSKIIGNSYIV